MRYVGAGVLCALLLAGCGGDQVDAVSEETNAAATGTAPAPAAPAATPATRPDARALAEQQAGPDARISAARSAWSQALAEHPDQTGEHIVSLAASVYLTRFLAADRSGGPTLGTLHLWLNDDRSLFPMAGQARHARLPQATEAAVAALTRLCDRILAREVAQAKATAGRADTEDKARARREHRYVVAARKDLSAKGPRLYGFTCTCTPAAVGRLVKASRAQIRLVERPTPGPHRASDVPLRPPARASPRPISPHSPGPGAISGEHPSQLRW